ncbi:succinate dehydrogenase assembly factor 4 [Caenispirillum bisanense]|uniref:succinate dehydrogenase assembly factor 4 n=1 Tax=Caenispirillum bisanense TaxID=414052 RepID=UPI0031D32B4D
MSDQTKPDPAVPAPPAPDAAAEAEGTAGTAGQAPASAIPTVNLRDMPPSQADEIGGPRGPEPTRYGDWERKGRVSDF